MNAAQVIPFRPIGDVEQLLIASWRSVAEVTHHFLVLLREFDLRQGWLADGHNDCAEWLDCNCGITRNTALEKLRVARALWSLPQIEEAFRRGDLSYSKVRALTRVARDGNETELLDYALRASASQVERYCRRLRNGDAVLSKEDARRVLENRSLSRHFREDGTGSLSVELPSEDLSLVMAAIEHVAATLPEDPNRSLFATAADALVQMAREVLAGQKGNGTSSDAYQVVVHVDATALENRGGGESDLPLETVRRFCCDGSVVPLIEDERGNPLNVGRKQRTVPTAIRRAVYARDRQCAWPGCHHETFLDLHHLEHWALGGETSLENIALLCTHHHKLVHEGGFTIESHREGGYYFARPDGRPVEHVRVPSSSERVEEPRATYRPSPFSAESDFTADQQVAWLKPPSVPRAAPRP